MNNEDIKVIKALKIVKKYCHEIECDDCCVLGFCNEEFENSPSAWGVPTPESQLTDDEKVILRNLNKKYKWIARDESGTLYAYEGEPRRNPGVFTGGGICVEMDYLNSLFQFIKWEDEPYLIEDLLKEG